MLDSPLTAFRRTPYSKIRRPLQKMYFPDLSYMKHLYWQDMIFRHKHVVQLANDPRALPTLDELQPRNNTYVRTYVGTHKQ
jgi:hypothetical protein